MASGSVNTTQQAGGALGLAVVASLAASSGRSAGFVLAAATLMLGVDPGRAPVAPGNHGPWSGCRAGADAGGTGS